MAERIPWDFTLPDQTCAGCGLQHPGEDCKLQDGLPLDEGGGVVTWCPICGSETDANGQCFEALPPLPVTGQAAGDKVGAQIKTAPAGAGASPTETEVESLVDAIHRTTFQAPNGDANRSSDGREPLTIAQILARAAKSDAGPLGDIARAAVEVKR